MVQPKISGLSIRYRLSLLTSALLLGAIVAFAAAAFFEVRRTAIAAVGEHADNVSRQLSQLLASSALQLRAQLRGLAARPVVREYARTRAPALEDSVRVQLATAHDVAGLVIAVELWDAAGRITGKSWAEMRLPDASSVRPTLTLASSKDSVAIGPLMLVGDTVVYAVAASVPSLLRVPAYVVMWRRASGSAATNRQLVALIGPRSLVLAGNTAGGVWTNFERAVPAPPPSVRTPRAPGAPRALSSGGLLTGVSLIPATPWSVVVEVPSQQAISESLRVLRNLLLFALLLLVGGAIGVWMLSERFARPISRLVDAAGAISSGDYSQRIAIARHDEIGVLGSAFNRMTESIADAETQLGEKVRELAASESRYRMLFDSNPHPMWVFDRPTLRFLAVNDAAVRTYGYAREDFLRMTIADIRPAEDLPELMQDVADGQAATRERRIWRHRLKNGTVIRVEVSAQAIDFDGHDARLVLAHDVTEREKAELALRATQQRLEHVMASSNAVIYNLKITDGRGALAWISENVMRILGYTSWETMRGGWWEENVHPNDLADTRGGVNPIVFRDSLREYRFRRKDGAYRWIRDEMRVLRDDQGNATEVVGAWLDITEQRSLEDQFRQAQKLEAVGRLAGGLAHDFNNLLTVVLGECDLALADLDENEAMAAPLNEIRRAGERASHLTNQLLMFSRKQLVEPRVVSYNELVTGMDSMLRRLIGEDVDFSTRVAPDLGSVRADRGQLEQVLVNLVINARDAMPHGGSLLIETKNVELDEHYSRSHAEVRPGRYVLLAVSDTGSGMSAGVQEHLFEPFFTTKQPGKGTGLGLATCYAIIKQFEGHIGVYSEVGKGTTMKIYLPRVHGALTPDHPTEAVATGGRETILLVEDDNQVRAVASRILRAKGYAVLEAPDGDVALQLLESHSGTVHLLLTDVVLPRMGGRVLAEKVAEVQPSVRVLFASGYTEDVILHHRLLERGIALLQKPFTSESLVRKVREILDQPLQSA